MIQELEDKACEEIRGGMEPISAEDAIRGSGKSYNMIDALAGNYGTGGMKYESS